MVSEAEFDKNQIKFRETMAQQQTTAMSQTQTTEPQLLDQIQTANANLRASGAMEDAMRFSPGLGVASAGTSMARGGLLGLGKKAIYVLGGLSLLGNVLNGIGGRTGELGNNFLSHMSDATGIDFTDANAKNKIIKDAYVTPYENPITGELEFLDPEGKLLEESARNQGMGLKSDDFQILKAQWDAEKADNQELANIYNRGLPDGFQREGEPALSAARRFVQATNKFQETALLDQFKANTPEGLSQAQVERVNQEFTQGRVAGEVEKQKQGSLQKPPPTVAELTKLPPGQMTPEEMEKVIKAKTPNEEKSTSPMPKVKPAPQEEAAKASISGGFSPICPAGFVWDAGLKRCVRDTGVSTGASRI